VWPSAWLASISVPPPQQGQAGPPKVSALPVLDQPGKPVTLAAGTEIDLLLQTPLDAGSLAPDARFEATTIAAVVKVGALLHLAPATARGFVGSVRKSGASRSTLTLSFDDLRVGEQAQRLRGLVTQVYRGRGGEPSEAAAAGVAPFEDRTPMAGVLVWGGTIGATDGKNVALPPGTILRVRLDQPIEVRSR
jgi:hypothetical protein